jgi:hypothetical protein
VPLRGRASGRHTLGRRLLARGGSAAVARPARPGAGLAAARPISPVSPGTRPDGSQSLKNSQVTAANTGSRIAPLYSM